MYEEFEPKEPFSRRAARELCDWIEAAMMAVVCVVLVFTFVVRLAGVDGASMMPTLEDHDRLIITRLGGEITQGDIVVVTLSDRGSDPLVKRVVATEGQVIDINFEQGTVYLDGQLLDEPYTAGPTMLSYDTTFPQTVPEGHIFMMGDNRNNSWDSRDSWIGMVDTRHILGRAIYRVFPLNRLGTP
ncbi:MAG: signal peptidase I [Oscillospiraceae bacterium]|nr:signal peptidase I [Oscillospiraceae bacterium]